MDMCIVRIKLEKLALNNVKTVNVVARIFDLFVG